jgi:hypothetical protein
MDLDSITRAIPARRRAPRGEPYMELPSICTPIGIPMFHAKVLRYNAGKMHDFNERMRYEENFLRG